MAYVEYNKECPSCGGSSSFGVDDKGWGRCFKPSCGYRVKIGDDTEGSLALAPTLDTTVVSLNPQSSSTEAYKSSQPILYKPIPDRKLQIQVCEKYGVGFRGDDIIFPVGSSAKVRLKGEKNFIIENKDYWKQNKEFFGQERFPKGGNTVLVVEGEFDALSAYQMLGETKYPIAVVSVRNGAQSALTDCENNFEWLDSFDSVVFCFDADKDGKLAQAKCAELFSHKAKTMVHTSPFKDASDYLVNNHQKDFVDAFWRADEYVPDGIVAGDTMFDLVMTPIEKADVLYPFHTINELTYGIRTGEMVTVVAGSGLGKSQFLREIIWHILQHTDENIGMMFLEESIQKTGLSLMSLAANKPLHLPDSIATEQEKEVAFNKTLGTGRTFLFEHFGSTEIENIISKVRYFARVKKCKYIFLDHISIIVSEQQYQNERTALDAISTKLRKLVAETGICLICVSHLKRPESKGHEDGAATSLSQIRGTGAIAHLSDIVIGLERNGQAEDAGERNTTRIRVLKNRFSGITGPAGSLLYSHETGRMNEVDDTL